MRHHHPGLRIVIPARGGSTRIPRKNLQWIVPGKSLLQWAVEFYQRALPGVPIVVATEDHETSKLAITLGCQLHGRCIEDIQDTRAGSGILFDMLDCHPGETILLAQCTSPFTLKSELSRALSNSLPYVQSAHIGKLHPIGDAKTKSQNLPTTTVFTGNFIIAREPFPAGLLCLPQFASHVSLLSAIDINNQSDLDEARHLAEIITHDYLLSH